MSNENVPRVPLTYHGNRVRRPAGNPKTTCSKCGHDLEDHRKNKYRYCNTCHAENMRQTRPKHSQLPEERRKKANARSYANVYLRKGRIERKPCEVCQSPDAQMHHDDYDKPLQIRWFCRAHHLDHHKSISNG
jgi:hypothetical protein